jgi:hypothetical protein
MLPANWQVIIEIPVTKGRRGGDIGFADFDRPHYEAAKEVE